MNSVVLMGRLTRDPETRYTPGDNAMAITRYTLAVDRRFKRDGEQTADFIPCVAFGKSAEFAEKYFRQGMRVSVSGRIQTGSYTNKEGNKVYTTDVVVDNQEFADGPRGQQGTVPAQQAAPGGGRAPQAAPPVQAPPTYDDGFMNIPEGIDEELPFN